MKPVPGYGMGTPYGRRGPWWSCRQIAGQGIHTGVDYPAPIGTRVVAARRCKVGYANSGTAVGFHQLEILHGDATRDFYAHLSTRLVANGARIRAGHVIGRVGSEGNVTGPHLHFERHSIAVGGWSCNIVRNPQPSIDFQPKKRKKKK